MKKLISLFLASMMLLPLLVSCGGKKAPTAAPETNTPETDAPPSDGNIQGWLGHGFDKIRVDQKMPKDAKDTYTVYLAKNESEGVHIGLRVENEKEKNLRFKVISGDNENIGIKIFEVRESITLGRKIYTDGMAPFGEGVRFSLEPGQTMVLFADFTTTKDTPAGDYLYELALTDKSGNVLKTFKITVHVWDFEMPEDLTFESAAGNFTSVEHYELLLEHNLSGYNLPYDILDERADKYMSDPRVTSFRVSYWKGDISDEKLLQYYEKLKSNPDWLDKAYFYPLDEPSTPEDVKELEKHCKHLKELCPEIKITSPYYKNLQITPEMDQIDFMSQYVDLHCPKLANWDESEIYDANQMNKYPSFDERMKALQERGDTVWAYVCNYPLAPYLNVKVDDEGIVSRVLFWQFYQRDIEGFLYWSTCYWTDDPWGDVDTFGNGIYGDGILTYPATAGVVGPYVPSIRLKIVRDGIDDIELLYLAEELFGREWVDERVNKTTTSLTSVDVTSDELYDIRVEIGNAIEDAKK